MNSASPLSISTFVVFGILASIAGCAKPLRTDTASFRLPELYKNHVVLESGLALAVDPVSTLDESEALFGTDIFEAGLFPVQIIVHNRGRNEYEIDASQVFAITPKSDFFVAYNLGQSAERVRGSSVGTSVAAGAAAGAILGAAVGAGIGVAADDAGRGAASGAIIGATAGAAGGASDSITLDFKKQLANLAFGNRVIYPADMQQGFIYFKNQPYTAIRIKIFDITDNTQRELVLELAE